MSDYEYKKTKYDSILFRVKKGKADDYRQAAQDLGIKFWDLIQAGVEEYIANHGGEEINSSQVMTSQPSEKLSAEQKKLVEEFSRLPPDAQKFLLKFLKALNEKPTPNIDCAYSVTNEANYK